MPGRLRELEITDFGATVLSTGEVSRVLIEWELKETRQDLTNMKYFIDRGESPEEMAVISSALPYNDLKQFVDYTIELRDLQKLYYYRVRAVEFNTAGNTALQTFQTTPFTWNGELDLVGIYVIDEHEFAFKFCYGTPTMIFKKKRDEENCPDCFDAVLARVTKSNCRTCFGVGKIGGYYNGIVAWMDFGQDMPASAVAESGEKQSNEISFRFTNYPEIRIGDIIVDLQPNKFFRVTNVSATEKRRATLLQFGQVSEIKRDEIEYALSIDDSVRDALVDELEQRRKEVEF